MQTVNKTLSELMAPKSEEGAAIIKGVPPEKAAEMIAYGQALKKKMPWIKKERLARKIQEHFKSVKVVD